MKTWYLIYTLWLGLTNTQGHQIIVAVAMPNEATCMLETDTFVFAAEVLEGPPDPNNLRGLYRPMDVLSKVCKWGDF